MGRDYNNNCYITGNFWRGVNEKYGDYFWEDQPCYEVVKILRFMLKMLEEDGFYPLTSYDINVREKVGSEWWWGHGDEIIKMDGEIKEGHRFKHKIKFERYFYVAYANTLDIFLGKATQCDSKSCIC